MQDFSKLSDIQLEMLIAKEKEALEAPGSSNPFANASPTGNAYLKQQAEKLGNLPGQLLSGLGNVAFSSIENPKQAAAGIPAGVASIGDLPAMLYNLGAWFPEKYAAYKYGEENVQPTSLPYVFHDTANKLADKVVGAPENEEEQQARMGGELSSIFFNPGRATGISKLARAGADKVASKAVSFNPEKYENFKAAGLSPSLGEVSNSRVIQRGENLVGEFPGGASPIGNHFAQREKDLENIFNTNVPPENIKTPTEMGKIVQEGARAYNDKARDVSKKLYNRAYSKLPAETPINLEKTYATINESLHALTPEARSLLESSEGGKKLSLLKDAIENHGGSLPLADLKDVFKPDLDDLINTWNKVGDADQRRLKIIVNTLGDDMSNVLIKKHPESAKALEKADNFWTQYSKENRKIANSLSDLKSMPTFRAAKNALKQGDITSVKIMTQRMPAKDKANFSATMMTELGLKDGQFNPDVWSKEFIKLRPESQKALLVGLPKSSEVKLRSVAEALQSAKESRRISNPSGTAYTGTLIGMIGSGVMGMFTLNPAMIATPLGATAITRYAGKVTTNEKFIDALYKASKATTPEAVAKAIPTLVEAAGRANISLDTLNEKPVEEAAETKDFSEVPEDELMQMIEAEKQKLQPSAPMEVAPTNVMPSPMPKQESEATDIESLINNSSLDAGMNPNFVRQVAAVESNLNPGAKAATSSAQGLFQFTDGTWREAINKYGQETGIGIKDRLNPEANSKIAALTLRDNALALKESLGREPKPVEVYLTHFLGLGGAKKFLGSRGDSLAARILPEAAKANRGIFFNGNKPRSVAEVYRLLDKKLQNA